MKKVLSKSWIRRYQSGPHHHIPGDNFKAVTQAARTLFESRIQGQPIDLYVYNADSGDLVFGRANLKNRYPRELAHHKGSLDIAVDHAQKEVYFKHLTLGLEDMLFPEELEWMSHIDSLQELAIEALRDIGMPDNYKKIVLKASEWARIRTGLMQGDYIPYEQWKKTFNERPAMKQIKLKKRPFFLKDLIFSNLLMKDKLLQIVIDRQNRVEEVRLDAKHYRAVLKELQARHYL